MNKKKPNFFLYVFTKKLIQDYGHKKWIYNRIIHWLAYNSIYSVYNTEFTHWLKAVTKLELLKRHYQIPTFSTPIELKEYLESIKKE